MKKQLSAMTAIVLLAAVTSRAQIGKDVHAADLMYGIPVAIGKDKAGFVQRAYRKGGRDIVATVVDGVIKRLVFSKYAGAAFTEAELRTIARKEGIRIPKNNQLPNEGSAWSVNQGEDATRAVYDPETNVLTITKDSYYKDRDEKMSSPAPGKKETGQ